MQVVESECFRTILLQRLREEEEGFHGVLATNLKEALPRKQECHIGAEHIYLVFVM